MDMNPKGDRTHNIYPYLMQEWDEELPRTFAVRRKTLEELDFAMQEWRLAKTETELTEHVETLIDASFVDARQVMRHWDRSLENVQLNVDQKRGNRIQEIRINLVF